MIPKNLPDSFARSVAASYLGRPVSTPSTAKPDPEASRRTAGFYEQARHAPHDPAVAASYAALKRETKAQYEHLLKSGVRLEPWTKPGQPYANSDEMMQDARGNKHLYFFTGGDMPKDHPLAEEALPGLTYNDLFRAVHDYFGHAMHGHQFGPTGEYRAWADHADMFSPEARPALSAETHGQNSWVNFGPHSHLPVTQRPYAEQKAFLLPQEHQPVKIKLLRAFEAHRLDYTNPQGVRRQRTVVSRMDPIDIHRRLTAAGHVIHSLTPATGAQAQQPRVRRESRVEAIDGPRPPKATDWRPGLEPPAKLSRPTAKQLQGASTHAAFRGTALAYHLAKLAKYARDRYGAKANPLLLQIRSILAGKGHTDLKRFGDRVNPFAAVGRYLDQYAGLSVPEALHGFGDKFNWETADRRHALDAALYSFIHDVHAKGDSNKADKAVREINVRLASLPDEKRREITAKLAKHLKGQQYVNGDSHGELLSSLGRLATYAKDREMVRSEADDARDQALRSHLESKGLTAAGLLENIDQNRAHSEQLTSALAKAAGTRGTHEQHLESLRRLMSKPAEAASHVGWRKWFESAKRWVHTPGGKATVQKRADPLRLAKRREPRGIANKYIKEARENKDSRRAAMEPPMSEQTKTLLAAGAPHYAVGDSITEAGHDYHGSVMADAIHAGHIVPFGSPTPGGFDVPAYPLEGHMRIGITRTADGTLARTLAIHEPGGKIHLAYAPATDHQLLEMVRHLGNVVTINRAKQLLAAGRLHGWAGTGGNG